MGKFRKLTGIIILAIAVFLAASYLGLLGGSAGDIKALDSKYDLASGKLVPGTIAELEAYSDELAQINPGNPGEASLVKIKRELVEMQKAVLSYESHVQGASISNPDCTPNGAVKSAIASAESAIGHARNALAEKPNAESVGGFAYIKSEDFDTSLNAVIADLGANNSTLKTICG